MDSVETIVFSKGEPASTINKRVNRGERVRLARGVYTTEVERDPADVVRERGLQPGDIAYPGGLHLASRQRGLAENCLPSRTRGGEVRRTLDEAELGDWIDYVFRQDYLDGLRMFSRQGDSSVFIKAMRYAHDFTAGIDFTDRHNAQAVMTRPARTDLSGP